jgi:hypothetical protein
MRPSAPVLPGLLVSALERFTEWLNSKGLNFSTILADKLLKKSKIKAVDAKGVEIPVERMITTVHLADGRVVNVEATDLEQAFRPRAANPDLIHFHKIKEFDFALDLKKERFSISLHGGKHFFRAVLEPHDIEQLAAIFLYAYAYRNKPKTVSQVIQFAGRKRLFVPAAILTRVKQVNAMVRTKQETRQN